MKKLICIIMVIICVVPAFAQLTPSTLSTFKEKMLEKKEYAGVVLHQSSQKIDPSDFMGDIFYSSDNWVITLIGDTMRSCYTYFENRGDVRLYMDINMTTGNVISLQRNSSGNIYWWTETWKPAYTTKETYKSNKVRLPKRVMNAQEKKCVAMFEKIIQIVMGTFSTGNAQADSLVYKCFTMKTLVDRKEFGKWETGFNNVFSYRFTQSAVKNDKDGFLIIDISLLDKKVVEVFKYSTVESTVTTKTSNGFTIETNPAFDPKKDIVSLPMTGELIPGLLEVFK